jgi:hypothetical protein
MGRRFNEDDFTVMRNGQVMADLQQGLTRGAMRLLEGNQAHACDVYVTVSDTPAGNVGALLATLFPDAQFFDGWGENAERIAVHKVGLSMRDRNIVGHLEQQKGDKVVWPSVYEALGIARSHFSAAMKRPRLVAAIEATGWEVVTGKRPNYFRRIA